MPFFSRLPYLLLFIAAFSHSTPNVAVSIKPLHSLTSSLMQDISEPTLLIEGSESPHDFQLKPSTLLTLKQADLIVIAGFGVDDQFKGIAPTFSFHDFHQDAISHEYRSEHNHDHETGHDDHDNHDSNAIDGHFWLDTRNAQAFVTALGTRLIAIDPSNQAIYERNMLTTLAKLEQLGTELTQQLTTLKALPFMVFHDGYQYFDKQFNLHWAGAISLNVQQSLNAKQLFSIKKELTDHHIVCVFAEPQFNQDALQNLIRGSQSRLGELDLLGNALPAGTEHYAQMMQQLADSFVQCLTAQ